MPEARLAEEKRVAEVARREVAAAEELRHREQEILEQQQLLLSHLQSLVEDTSTFNGHATFNRDGFAENHLLRHVERGEQSVPAPEDREADAQSLDHPQP